MPKRVAPADPTAISKMKLALKGPLWWRFSKRFRPLKWAYQRARRGWADCDVWNLDSYLFHILAETLPRLRDSRSGSPCDCKPPISDHTCHDRWTAELTGAAQLFERLSEHEYWRIELLEKAVEAEEKDFAEAMAWLAKRMRNLWD